MKEKKEKKKKNMKCYLYFYKWILNWKWWIRKRMRGKSDSLPIPKIASVFLNEKVEILKLKHLWMKLKAQKKFRGVKKVD